MKKAAEPQQRRTDRVLLVYVSAITCAAMLFTTIYQMAVSQVAIWAIFLTMTGFAAIMPIQLAVLWQWQPQKSNLPQLKDSSSSSH